MILWVALGFGTAARPISKTVTGPTPLHVDRDSAGRDAVGHTLLRYGRVTGHNVLTIGATDYLVRSGDLFTIPRGVQHSVSGTGTREYSATDAVTGAGLGEPSQSDKCDEVPDNGHLIIGSDITELSTGEYRGCDNIISVRFENPNAVVAIGGDAFFSCDNLVEVVLPTGFTEKDYEGYQFASCDKLRFVTLPASILEDDRNFRSMFSNCPELKEITFLGDPPDEINTYLMDGRDDGASGNYLLRSICESTYLGIHDYDFSNEKTEDHDYTDYNENANPDTGDSPTCIRGKAAQMVVNYAKLNLPGCPLTVCADSDPESDSDPEFPVWAIVVVSVVGVVIVGVSIYQIRKRYSGAGKAVEIPTGALIF